MVPFEIKIKRKIIIGFFIFIQCLSLFIPGTAQALFGVGDTNIILQDIPRDVVGKVERSIFDSIAFSAISSAMSAVTYFVRKIAYDAATYIVSGDKGQGALVHTSSVGDYLLDTLGDATGDAIGKLGEPFGLNLCQFPLYDLDLQVNLQLGLRSLYGLGPPTPECSWQDLKDGWDPERFTEK